MDERLWMLTRRDQDAVGVLRDCGVNGFEVQVTVAQVVASVDRFVTKELAVDHAARERQRLERAGWR